MPQWKRCGFVAVFAIPGLLPLTAWLSTRLGHADPLAWLPLFVLFVLLPLADRALGHDPSNPAPDQIPALAAERWFRWLTLLALPVQYLTLGWSLWFWIHAGLGPVGSIGWLLSLGVVGGVMAINVAHELIHKDTTLERFVGGLLLISVGYHGFKVEHIRGHHVHVATPLDPSTARWGQSLWRFLPRALIRNTVNAWRLEADRLRRQGLSWWHWRNELIGWTAGWAMLAFGIGLWLGPRGVVGFLVQGLVAACALEVINYVEHYGLERRRLADGRYERTTHLHSWNADFALSNLLLFHLQRHSDHHAHASRRYQVLLHHPDSPQLPAGYATMFVLALIPPVWFRVMHPRLAQWRMQRGTSG
jgi:alkane 1-monooxygenase